VNISQNKRKESEVMIRTDRPMGDMLTVSEVARQCDVNPETVRRWAREEKVPASRVGGMLFFRVRDIEAMTNGGASHE